MVTVRPRPLRIAIASLARTLLGAPGWVVGYPKCGNTWFSLMLRKALALSYALPDVALARALSDWRPVGALRRVPAIGMTHHMPRFNSESYRTMSLDLRQFRRRRVVLLIREAKDVLVSLYMHNVYREARPLFHGDVNAMVHSEIYGIEKYLTYYATWYAHRGEPEDLLLVRYEDLSRDPRAVLAAALQFLRIPRVTDALVREVVAFASFENMRKLETADTLRLPSLSPPATRRVEGFKVRKGVVGDHVNHLDPATIAHIDRRVAESLPAFYGYPGGRGATSDGDVRAPA